MRLKSVLALLCVGVIFGLLSGCLLPCIFGSGVMCATIPILGKGADIGNVIKGLKEERGLVIEEMDSMINKSEAEARSFSDEEDKDYKKKENELRSFNDRIVRLEEKQKRSADDAGKTRKDIEDESAEEREAQERKLYRTYLQKGMGTLSQEDRDTLQERAMSTQDGQHGGYLIPTGFAVEIDLALKAYGGILSAGTLISTTTGNSIPYPTLNDTNNMGARLGENTDAGDSTEPSVGTINIEAHTYSSKPIIVPNQLLQDSAFNLEAYLNTMMVERIARIVNKEFTTGDGNNMPAGVLTKSVEGAKALSDGITYDNLVDLFHSVDENYRKDGSWMFTDGTLKALRKLKDSEGKPIWQESLRTGEPSTLLGKPYIISSEMEDISTGKKSIIFGSLKKYLIREVAGASILRLTERYAEKNQTGFLLFKRYDGKLIDAGTHPVKHLIHG